MTVWVSLGVATLTFAFGMAGLYLQKLLPERHTSERSRDMIAAIVGLLSLLLALVLGTLIGSAFSFYSTQKSEMETFASRALQLDLALAEYGPETAAARAGMKETLTRVRRMLWWRGGPDRLKPDFTVAEPLKPLRAMDEYIASLDPKTPAQHQFQAAAEGYASAMEQTRFLISLQLASPVSWPLVVIVVSWAMILFGGFGVLSRINATTIVALGFGAFAVGSALFLILELNEPFTGVFRLPPAAIDQMLASLDK
jgi:ABC-type antimicrobial peptide transport system permease subunit